MSRIDLPKIYNPANQTRKELIENFVVRTKIFQEIFEDIKTSKMKHPEQHYIIQGIRGQGKTTLLLRLAYEIQNDKELNKWLIPIVFSEEQYKVRKLYKLWEVTAEYLKEFKGFEKIYDEMQEFEFDEDYEIHCIQLLEKFTKQNKKKIILFIDNIGDILNKFPKKEQHRLREVLLESAEMRIIGASSVSLEFHYDYGKPFFEFFRMPQLKGLSMEETKTLLLSLGKYYKKERVKEIVKNQAGRIEALRRLSSGVIRTIILLFAIFIDDENGDAFNDLEKILDEVTPLYKHRMDSLSAQQQEIVDIIALNWDAVSTKEISFAMKEQGKAISSQLKVLIKNHLIEKQGTNTKNYLYRLEERFFNIWYLMRHGRKKDENKVKWLVEFLQIWCDKKELERRTLKHIESIHKGIIYEKQALYMTEALARTLIPYKLQDRLINETRSYLTKIDKDLLKELSESDLSLFKKATEFINKKEFNCALQSLLKMKNKNEKVYYNLAFLYQTKFKDFKKAEKYYLMAVEKEDADAIFNLALLYKTEFKDFKKAEKYYLMAVKKEHSGAMFNLAILYQTKFNNFKNAEKYYLMAIEKDHTDAMFNLAVLYQTKFKDFKKAEKYYLMAIEKEDSGAMFNLAVLYQTKFKDFKNAEKYYLMAIEKEHTDAMNNLAILYKTKFNDFKNAEKYYLMAVEKEDAEAMFNLALLYQTEFNDFKNAEKYYLMAIEKDHTDAMFNLAVLYQTKFKDFKKAEKYYLMANDTDSKYPLNNLSRMYYKNIMDKRKGLAYAKKGYEIKKSINISHTYTMILLWNNEIEQALEISKDFMENGKVYEKFPNDIREFLMLLIAKKQHHSVFKIFNENSFQLKDRFKPIYYALMFFMQKEYPNEYIKMGSELKQTVEEIIISINNMAEKYK